MKRYRAYLIPSAGDLVFLPIFLILVVNHRRLLMDGDTGYHIRAGDFILQNRIVPKADIFSLWTPPLPWTAHEWLSELLMAASHRFMGITGTVILFSLTAALTYLCLFRMLKLRGADPLLALLITTTAAVCSSLHWLARPHMFSLLLTIVWYRLLDRYQYENTNRLYLLPLIVLLWVNLHGGYIFGLLLLLVYIGGNLVSAVLESREESGRHYQKARLFFITLLACLSVTLINPNGYDILIFPFRLTFDTFIMSHVQEFLSPNFQKALPFKYLFLGSIALFALSRRSLNCIELSLLLLVTYMSLHSARYIPLFSIVTAPILLRLLQGLLSDHDGWMRRWFLRRLSNFAILVNPLKGFVWSAAAVMAVLLLGHGHVLRADFDHEVFPQAAVEFLKTEPIAGNMFNNDEFGDYLIYTAWPDYKVFFDGRSDMYGTALGKDYLTLARTLPGWEDILKKHQVQWVFFNTYSPLSAQLSNHPDWHLIYSDRIANIFVRNEPEYQYLIAKYSSAGLSNAESNR